MREKAEKMLIVGLGPGDLHSFLLFHFPCLVIDSVELDPIVLQQSISILGFDYNVCNMLELDNSTGTLSKLFQNQTFQTINNNNNIDFNQYYDSSNCRSNVIIADGWDYINHIYIKNVNNLINNNNHPVEKKPVQTNNIIPNAINDPYNNNWDIFYSKLNNNQIKYKYIMMDAFSFPAATWTGNNNEGYSNSDVIRAINHLQKVKSLLEMNGLAIFHLHHDSMHDYYVTEIEKVFGKENVVFLRVTLNGNIIVGINRLLNQTCEENNNNGSGTCLSELTVSHPCDDPKQFISHVIEFGFKSNYETRNIFMPSTSLACGTDSNNDNNNEIVDE
eukprot:gene7942-10776_t